MGVSEEQTKGFQRLEVSTRGKRMEIQVKKFIFGVTPPHVEHPTLVERIGIKFYTRNDMLHMMLEMGYIMQVIPALEMYYLVHHFQIYIQVGVTPPMLGAHITKKLISFHVGNR